MLQYTRRSKSDSWKTKPNPWILNQITSPEINTCIIGEETMENSQCDLSTPMKFCYDLNLTPEEVLSTSLQPTEPEFSPVALDMSKNVLSEVDQEPHVPVVPEIGTHSGENKRKRAQDDELKLKTPKQPQRRKKMRAKVEELVLKTPKQPQRRKRFLPKVAREGNTKRTVSKPKVKKTVSAPKRSTRRSLRFDNDLKEEEEEEYCGITFTSEGCIGICLGGEIVSQLFGKIPKGRRQRRTNPAVKTLGEDPKAMTITMNDHTIIGSKPLSLIPNNFCLQFPNFPRKQRTYGSQCNPSASVTPTLSPVNTVQATFLEPEGHLSDDSYIFQNNLKKFRRKRSSVVTRPRNSLSLQRILEGLRPIKRGRRGYKKSVKSPQCKAIVPKIQTDITRKKRSSTDPIASQLNAKVLQLQWQRLKATGSSSNEILELRCSLDVIIKLFKELNINSESSCLPHNRETALVLHQKTIKEQKKMVRDGSIILHSGGKKYQPQIILDDETTRVWNLLMVSSESEGVDGTDEHTEKWWEKERKVFQMRANSFITRMRLVQGDRRFSPWKGSVVDSVVGVFLTQNVTDHASSSAFMDVASAFPINLSSGTVSNHEELGSSMAHETVMNLDMGNEVPTCFIVHEVDDDEDIDVGCTQETTITNDSPCSSPIQSKAMLLDPPSDKPETNFVSEAMETVNIDEEEKMRKAEEKVVTGKKPKKGKEKPKESFDWDSLRRQVVNGGQVRERTESTKDIVDWEALRCTDVDKIAAIIRKRGMHNQLSQRIKAFLNRLVLDHGSIDLEWLRDVPPDKVKDYLLSINGLGLKSVDCVRLLSLHQTAFPVDTNVGRIVVRLGWVPLQPLPDQLQMHLLELYPILASVQKYLWPRLCKLDPKTLYELHYHMITFGKVFCTKVKPNCNACPLKAECRHYASARASARLALPEPEENTTEVADDIRHNTKPMEINFQQTSFLDQDIEQNAPKSNNCEPIIEEPRTPEREFVVPDIEDYPWNDKTSTIIGGDTSEDPWENDAIPTIMLNKEACTSIDPWEDTNAIPTIMLNKEACTSIDPWENKDSISTIILHKEACTSKDLVLSTQTSSRPTRKLKSLEKLRTEHIVYELPDFHRILQGFEKREPKDMFPYLLAIWTPGETANSIEPPRKRCVSQENDTLCSEKTCFSCNSTREDMSQTVRGTILIPCRTAMRGGFPLNGTYFQTNEVFADHGSSINPIDVPREWIWNLPRRIAYFGSSVTAIFGGLSVEAIQYSFWRGYVCVRGFDRQSRTSKMLVKRLHWPPKKPSQEDDNES